MPIHLWLRRQQRRGRREVELRCFELFCFVEEIQCRTADQPVG